MIFGITLHKITYAVADRVVDTILDVTETLVDFPEAGSEQQGFRRPVRRIVSGPFSIFYSYSIALSLSKEYCTVPNNRRIVLSDNILAIC